MTLIVGGCEGSRVGTRHMGPFFSTSASQVRSPQSQWGYTEHQRDTHTAPALYLYLAVSILLSHLQTIPSLFFIPFPLSSTNSTFTHLPFLLLPFSQPQQTLKNEFLDVVSATPTHPFLLQTLHSSLLNSQF